LNEAVEILKGATGYAGEVKYAGERGGDVKHSLADISLAKERLGYELLVQFREGIERTVDWYKGIAVSSWTTPASSKTVSKDKAFARSPKATASRPPPSAGYSASARPSFSTKSPEEPFFTLCEKGSENPPRKPNRINGPFYPKSCVERYALSHSGTARASLMDLSSSVPPRGKYSQS
jgi:hypothetical protein